MLTKMCYISILYSIFQTEMFVHFIILFLRTLFLFVGLFEFYMVCVVTPFQMYYYYYYSA